MAIYGDEKHNENMEHIDNTNSYKVSLTFDCINAKNPLEATKQILNWILNNDGAGGAETMSFDVVDENTLETFTVDLSEEDSEAVLPIK